jgi:excisionase family DNA binding protein
MHTPLQSEYITIPQAIGLLQVSPATLYRMIKSGELKSVKIGRSTRIYKSSIPTLDQGGISHD